MDAAFLTVDASNRPNRKRAKWHGTYLSAGMRPHLVTACSGLRVDETSANLPAAVPPTNRCRANGCRQQWALVPAHEGEDA